MKFSATLTLLTAWWHLLGIVIGTFHLDTGRCCHNELTKCNITLKSDGDNQCLDAEVYVPYDLKNNNYLIQSKLQLYMRDRWMDLIETKPEDGCRFIKRYIGSTANDLLVHIGLKPGTCNIKKGRYTVKNYCVNVAILKTPIVPKGKVRCVLNILLKENRKEVACLEGIAVNN